MDLQHKQSKTVSVTSMSFLSGDVNNFVVGSEDGSVFTGHRHGRYIQIHGQLMSSCMLYCDFASC